METLQINSVFEKLRAGLVDQLAVNDFENEADRLGVALYSYIAFQRKYAQFLLPEGSRLSDVEDKNIDDIVMMFTQHLKVLLHDFQCMLGNSECRDYYIGFVSPILMQFDRDAVGNAHDKICVDLNNKTIHDYLVAALSVCLRASYMNLSATDVISLLENDSLGEFTYNATEPRDSYLWVKDEFDIPVSDISSFLAEHERLSTEMPMADLDRAKTAIQGLDRLMEKAMPIFCGQVLSGFKEDSDQKAFTSRLMEMVHDNRYREGLSSMFSCGVVILALIPESLDVQELLSTHEQCVEFFDRYYDVMAGPAVKDFYGNLNDYDKNVARTCFLGGLITAMVASLQDENGCSLLGIKQGSAYNNPSNIK